MLKNLREDLRRYGATPRLRLASIVQSPGAWATVAYRFAHWVYTANLPAPLRLLGKLLAVVVQDLAVMATSIQIPARATIGPGLLIAHTGYVVLSFEARLGRHCTLTQGVTIGHGGGGTRGMLVSPRIGNRVYIGPGAIVIGDVEVGDDALIGAGAVVTRSVPPRAVVVGNPGRVISYKGSFDLIAYPGMESDAERLASLEAAKALIS
jgi:serine O-acetyltransferase